MIKQLKEGQQGLYVCRHGQVLEVADQSVEAVGPCPAC
jgi:hypothetical protein